MIFIQESALELPILLTSGPRGLSLTNRPLSAQSLTSYMVSEPRKLDTDLESHSMHFVERREQRYRDSFALRQRRIFLPTKPNHEHTRIIMNKVDSKCQFSRPVRYYYSLHPSS